MCFKEQEIVFNTFVGGIPVALCIFNAVTKTFNAMALSGVFHLLITAARGNLHL